MLHVDFPQLAVSIVFLANASIQVINYTQMNLSQIVHITEQWVNDFLREVRVPLQCSPACPSSYSARHTHTNTHTHARTHAHTQTHTHTHTHTHTILLLRLFICREWPYTVPPSTFAKAYRGTMAEEKGHMMEKKREFAKAKERETLVGIWHGHTHTHKKKNTHTHMHKDTDVWWTYFKV